MKCRTLLSHFAPAILLIMNNVLRCLSKAVFIPTVEKFCQIFEETKRYAQTHKGHGQMACRKNRKEVGKIKWISGKLVVRVRSGSNWRAVVLSAIALYSLVRLSASSGSSLLRYARNDRYNRVCATV
jgi:hypothetical protein